MKMSTKGRYGLRAMVDLAIHSTGEHVALRNIAERQKISDPYLEQVFSTLRKAGLIKSIKGAQGGYVLTQNPSQISVGDILRVMEGDLSIVEETIEHGEDGLDVEYCLTTSLWSKINESILQVVDSITLEDLMQDYKRMQQKSDVMYYI